MCIRDSSNADIAKDLRLLIRDELLNGKTDQEIINFIHSRYGDFILYKPPIRFYTIFLWVFPFIFFLSFLISIIFCKVSWGYKISGELEESITLNMAGGIIPNSEYILIVSLGFGPKSTFFF